MTGLAESLKRLIPGQKNKIKCQLCGKTFSAREEFDNHMKMVHK